MTLATRDVETPTGAPFPAGDASFRIEDRLVQPSLNRISFNGTTVTIEPKIMRVLLRLSATPGTVVTKEELLETAWQGTFVTEDVLTRAVGELRRIFADDAARPRVIETIRKKGYRLLLAPGAAEITLPPGAPVPPTAGSGAEIPSLPPAPALPAAPARSRSLGIALAAGVVVAAAAIGIAFRSSNKPRGPVRILPITTLPGNEQGPALSFDGTRVAFAWKEPGGTTSIYVKLVDAPAAVRLTTSPTADHSPAWSPDGQRIAFIRGAGTPCEIFTVPATGGAAQRLADCAGRSTWKMSWSPSGSTLAIPALSPAGGLGIDLLDVASGARTRLTAPGAGGPEDEEPAFSPDGRNVSFLRSLADGVSDIFVVSASGGEPRRVTFENRSITGADWTSDGREIVFSSSRAGLFSLWRVPLGGGEPKLVAGGGSKMKHPSTARARNAVAYENWHYEVNLWSVPIDAAAARSGSQLTFAADEWEFDPEYSADGRRVAYVSTKSGADEIWIVDAAGKNPVQLTKFGGPRLGAPRWSADGRRLVFVARPEGQADLYTIDAAGGPPARLTSTPEDEAAPSWSRDGRLVYYASRRSGAWEIWSIPARGGEPRKVTSAGGSVAFESADGRSILFSKAQTAGIWSAPVSGGEERLLPIPLAPNCGGDWRATGRGIYFKVDRDDDRPLIRFLPFGATEAKTVATLDNQAWAGFTVSPDDSSLVYGRADRRESDIRMIENGF